MSGANTRRHYRVAKKSVQRQPARGRFISINEQRRLIPIAAVLILFFFIKGFIVGYLFGNFTNSDSD